MKSSSLLVFSLIQFLIIISFSQNIPAQQYSAGTIIVGEKSIQETTQQIMARDILLGPTEPRPAEIEKEKLNRKNLPQNPESPKLSSWPPIKNQTDNKVIKITTPQTADISFTAATLDGTNRTGFFPPDCMGAVGPTQYIVMVNGRIVSFDKSTGLADGILNTTTDNFFASVLTSGAGTTDPRIRYDRLAERWFTVIIDVSVNISNVAQRNRILLAVSEGKIISSSTTWNFFYFNSESSKFADYPTLGIDNNALYIGTNMFTTGLGNTFSYSSIYVVRKNSILGSGPIVVTNFANVTGGTAAGPYTPQGVDNFDPSATVGYFIGVNINSYGKLMLRRITDPGGTPSISANIQITVNNTASPLDVPHLGNTKGDAGKLDALDDRLFAAAIRNGNLWTAHNILVNSSGIADGNTTTGRDASRWYEISNLNSTPTVVQSGTIFQSGTNPRFYWIPSIMVSGQGHAAMGFSTAGVNEYANAATVGRLADDALGMMGTPELLTSSSTAYNAPYNRWGDYSYTCVDPDDDMTMWTVQEFCDATDSYGVRVVKLFAPPPAEPVNAQAVPPDQNSINTVVDGSSINGSGFFDPGAGFANHISASVSGGIIVNSVTYTSPTEITLNLNTTGIPDGYYDVTITNPDGQTATGVNVLQIDQALPVELISFEAKSSSHKINLSWTTATEVNNYGFDIEKKTVSNPEWEKIGFVEGHGNSNSFHSYFYADDNIANNTNFNYRLKQLDNDGKYTYSKIVEAEIIPDKFYLSQNFPNPFNPVTSINYELPADSKVILKVYNLLGEEISTLVDENKKAGKYKLNFNAEKISSGVYFYKITAGTFSNIKKMVILK